MNTEFERFIEAIKLTSEQRKDARRKYDGVCKALHDHHYPNYQYNGDTRFLIGSYGKKTHIQPARDVDVIFIMPPEKFADYADNQSNPQSQLLQDIRSILMDKYKSTPIKAWGKVVAVEFGSPQHKVEVQPAWEKEDGTFIIPNSEDGGSWEVVNPREEIRRIRESDQVTGKTKSLIRMIKKWSEQTSAKVRSHGIEREVLSFFSTHTAHINYSSLVKDFFEHFLSQSSDESIKSHLKTAHNRAVKACKFEQDSQTSEALEEWRKIFGHKFPSETVKRALATETSIAELIAKYPSSKEQFIDKDYGYEIALNPSYRIEIDAFLHKFKGFKDGTWLNYLLKSRMGKLLKRIRVKFQVTYNDVPKPYRLYWKIRNFGDEAKLATGLRGEIKPDEGGEEKVESTLYYGTHLVECYVVKDGKCVAIGRTFVPIGNEVE